MITTVTSIKPITKAVKKGLAMAFDQYDAYQIAKYKRSTHTISLVDVVNLVHPVPTQANAAALQALIRNEKLTANTWETKLSAGEDKADTFTRMIKENKLGALAMLRNLRGMIDAGGIFTHQLCEWLKAEGLAKDADRLVVLSDSQDIDAAYGKSVIPDTTPYKTSYIIDISTHTHGIKTGNWTAEINGWSDRIFHYIAELEKGM